MKKYLQHTIFDIVVGTFVVLLLVIGIIIAPIYNIWRHDTGDANICSFFKRLFKAL